ncbi:unnamed protein product [Cunninghamella blakesleeana]
MLAQVINTNNQPFESSLGYHANQGQTQANSATITDEKKKKKKELRKAVGIVVIDPATKRVLMVSSQKREGAYVLPRGDCNLEKNESFEDCALRTLKEKACIEAKGFSRRIGTFAEASKRGKTVGHHTMFEVTDFTVLSASKDYSRERVWVEYNRALMATQDRPMSHLALTSSTLSSLHH